MLFSSFLEQTHYLRLVETRETSILHSVVVALLELSFQVIFFFVEIYILLAHLLPLFAASANSVMLLQ